MSELNKPRQDEDLVIEPWQLVGKSQCDDPTLFLPNFGRTFSQKPRMERRLWMTCLFIAKRLASPGRIMGYRYLVAKCSEYFSPFFALLLASQIWQLGNSLGRAKQETSIQDI